MLGVLGAVQGFLSDHPTPKGVSRASLNPTDCLGILPCQWDYFRALPNQTGCLYHPKALSVMFPATGASVSYLIPRHYLGCLVIPLGVKSGISPHERVYSRVSLELSQVSLGPAGGAISGFCSLGVISAISLHQKASLYVTSLGFSPTYTEAVLGGSVP